MDKWIIMVYQVVASEKKYIYSNDGTRFKLSDVFIDSLWKEDDTFCGMHFDYYKTELPLQDYITFKGLGDSDEKIALSTWDPLTWKAK